MPPVYDPSIRVLPTSPVILPAFWNKPGDENLAAFRGSPIAGILCPDDGLPLAVRTYHTHDLRKIQRFAQKDAAKSARFCFKHHVGQGTRNDSGGVRTIEFGPNQQLQSVVLPQADFRNQGLRQLFGP